MAGTLLTRSEPLNDFGGHRQVHAVAWLGHSRGWGCASVNGRDYEE